MLRRIPLSYAVLLLALAALGALFALVWFNVISIPALYFQLTNIVVLTLLFVFAALGGAFIGMLMTHRMLANREFSPAERAILEVNAELKTIGKRLAALEDGLAEKARRP